MAAMVSSVSPDWLMTMASVPSSTMGSEYRNSDARQTSTGMRVSFSRLYFATMHTCSDEPQAIMSILRIFVASRDNPSKTTRPSWTRGLIARRSASGCSMISLSMKCS